MRFASVLLALFLITGIARSAQAQQPIIYSVYGEMLHLTTVTDPTGGVTTYTYDATGNRTGVGGSFARTLLPDPIASATYDAANQQLTFGDKTMTYDANGNLTTITDLSGVTTLTWDARNRLASLSGPGTTASFGYDAIGCRATKQINSSTTQYLYDGLDIVQ